MSALSVAVVCYLRTPSALVRAFFRAVLPQVGQLTPGGSASQSSPVFTPAHPSALDAVRDFFERRRPPVQPVAFAHNVHLANGMQCTGCHVGVDQGPDAVIPNVKLCMTCHEVIAKDHPEIKKIAAYMARGEEIPWDRVYDYSPSAHVKFNHAAHIRSKVACASCHGEMTRQTTAQRVVSLTMGYCIDCHKQRRASIDCMTCHF
jgi:hypothetical protein